jgi:hypothetical protein
MLRRNVEREPKGEETFLAPLVAQPKAIQFCMMLTTVLTRLRSVDKRKAASLPRGGSL